MKYELKNNILNKLIALGVLVWSGGNLWHEVEDPEDPRKHLLNAKNNGKYTYWDSDKESWVEYTGDEQKILKTVILDRS